MTLPSGRDISNKTSNQAYGIFCHNENRKFHIAETGSKRELLINKILPENAQISLDLHLCNMSRVLSIDTRRNLKSRVQRANLG